MSKRLSAWLVSSLSAILALGAGPGAEASGRKGATFLSFHVEAEAVEEGKMVERVRLGNKDYFFRKVPEFTDDYIDSFYPFPAENGKSYGAAFRMNKTGSQRLAVVTQLNLDRRLLTAVNQQPISFVIIDKAISDGVIVVWSGLTEEHLELFEKSMKRGEMEDRSQATGGGEGGPGLVPAGESSTGTGNGSPQPEAKKEKEKRRLFGRFRKKEKSAADEAADFAEEYSPVPQ